jgi:hypothetical protein
MGTILRDMELRSKSKATWERKIKPEVLFDGLKGDIRQGDPIAPSGLPDYRTAITAGHANE